MRKLPSAKGESKHIKRHCSLQRWIAIGLLILSALPTWAQCSFKNTAFKSGEFLSYNLYYNWKFVWVKAGTASMSTVQSNYQGHQAYRASLITRGNKKVDDLFVLRDTLLCYSTLDMAPLYFRKGAREGKRYTVDEVFYDYKNGQVNLKLHRQRNDGSHIWNKHSQEDCVFDMLNIFLRARSFNPEGWKKGHVVRIPIADGRDINQAILKYRGKTTIKADNGHKYRCLQLSYMEKEKDDFKEIARFYVSDDSNHIPVRIDMFLRFGSAKAFLVGMQGLKNPVTALEK